MTKIVLPPLPQIETEKGVFKPQLWFTLKEVKAIQKETAEAVERQLKEQDNGNRTA